MTAAEIKDQLESMCESAEDMTIRRELGEEERIKFQMELSNNAVKRAILEDAFEKIKQEYKTNDNPLKLRNGEIIKTLRTNTVEEDGLVYNVANHEEGRMEMYSEHGHLVNTRPLMPEERQRNLSADSVSMTKAG